MSCPKPIRVNKILFYFLIEVKVTLYKNNHFEEICSLAFNIFRFFAATNSIELQKFFITPKGSPGLIGQLTLPSPTFLWPLTTTRLLSLSMDLPILDFFVLIDHKICHPFNLVSVPWCNIFEVHPHVQHVSVLHSF